MNFPNYNNKQRFGNSSEQSFDLNIDNYTVDDLFTIYKIKRHDQANVTEDVLKKITGEIINNYYSINNISGNHDNSDEYVMFFNKANSRLIQHIQSGSAFINDSMYQHKTNKQYNDNSLVGGEQHIILKNDEPYQNAVIHEYPKGTINPIERRTLKRIISIDSLFRSNHDKTKSTDFIWNIPSPINNVLSLQIVSAQVPNMVRTYSNEKLNNIFTINLYNVNIGSSVIISYSTKIKIPQGSYMADSFPVIMNYYLANAIPPIEANGFNGLQFLYFEVDDKTTHTIIRTKEAADTDFATLARPFVVGPHYSPNFYFTVDFNVPDDKSFTEYYKCNNGTTGTIIRAHPLDLSSNECSNTGFQRTHMNSKNLECFRPTINPHDGNISHKKTKMRPLYKNAGWMMGFKKDFYDTSVDCSFTTFIKETVDFVPITYHKYISSESSYGSSMLQYFFIEIDDFNRNFTSNTIIAESGNGTYLGNNIIARIPITTSSFSIMHTNPSDLIYKRRDYFGPVKIEKMNIRLLDKFGEILDITDNDYSIAIELTTLY